MKVPKERQAEALAMLQKFLKPGSTVYTVLRHVSRSGMMRRIDLYTFDKEGTKLFLTGYASSVLGEPWDSKNGGLKVTGCGMDMGFHIVYALSYALFKAGFKCIGKECPANDHHNPGREKYRKGILHTDPGYALRQEWI
jgi:hypothetical protein